MNKKGFTLIELLAVIVILAIIALIATPIVLNIINDAKEESELRSAEFYLKSLELSIAQATLDGQNIEAKTYNIMPNGNICLEEYSKVGDTIECKNKDEDPNNNELVVEVKGKVPSSGTIAITNGQVGDLSLKLENKIIVKDDKGELVYSESKKEEIKPLTLPFCDLKEETSNIIGSKYSCDFGGGARNFYILELGTNPVPSSILKNDEVALILEGNYDISTQPWCASGSDVSCNADGLTSKLDGIAEVWTKLSRNQIVIPTAEQLATADGKVYTDGPSLSPWLYNWPDNENYTTDTPPSVAPYGYWTLTPYPNDHNDSVYIVWFYGDLSSQMSNSSNTFGIRPVVNLKIK